jgi:hypothetical protein
MALVTHPDVEEWPDFAECHYRALQPAYHSLKH